MAEHSTIFSGPETEEALLADRQRVWGAFTSATTGGIIFMVLLLIAMGVFLL
jgi:hypothetical protein